MCIRGCRLLPICIAAYVYCEKAAALLVCSHRQTLMQFMQETICGLHACLLCTSSVHVASLCLHASAHASALPCAQWQQMFCIQSPALHACRSTAKYSLFIAKTQVIEITATAVVSYHVLSCRRMHAVSVMETCGRGEAGLHRSWYGVRKAVAIMYMHAALMCGQSIR